MVVNPLLDASPPQFISDVYPATGAAATDGTVLVSWASGRDPSAPSEPTGVFANVSDAFGSFGSPQQLADERNATLPQPTGPAMTSSRALVAWTGPLGAQVAQSSQPK